MNRADSAFLTVALVLVAFTIVYYASPPAPRYYPVEHTWRMTKEKGKPSMGWYGRSAWGLGVAGLVGVLVYTVAFRLRKDGAERRLPTWAVRLLTVFALICVVALMVHIVCHEFTHWGTWGIWDVPK